MTKEEHQSADAAVRDYLLFLSDPSSLVDSAAQERITGQLSRTKDPLERLRLLSARQKATVVDGSSLRVAFLKSASEFARRENITVEAFVEMGVPREDLRAAGLLPPGKGSRSTGKRRQTSGGPVGRETVLARIPDGPFTLKSLEQMSGASPLTVRRAVEGLVESGLVRALGADPEHSGRGRAPNLYARVEQAPESTETDSVKAKPAKRPAAKRPAAKRAPAGRASTKASTGSRSARKKSAG